jgi:hypothetical protein
VNQFEIMKKNILLFAILMLLGFGSMAQEPSRAEIPAEDRMKEFIDRISPKLNLSKGQKDSLTAIFVRFMDDIQKYHAENNAKVITFMMKTRDEKVKNLLHDTLKFDKYLLVMEDIKKQNTSQHGPVQAPQQGRQHQQMGGDRNF